jgi:hypothetical protein
VGEVAVRITPSAKETSSGLWMNVRSRLLPGLALSGLSAVILGLLPSFGVGVELKQDLCTRLHPILGYLHSPRSLAEVSIFPARVAPPGTGTCLCARSL